MKTQIATTDLLKILNPNKDEVIYKDQKVKIDLKKLKEFVELPKKNEVFNLTGDLTNDLHKNLALYIINDHEESHLIHIDLNKENIFEPGKGLFEYIKNFYNKNQTCFIDIDESGDNLLLIKSKKLEALPNASSMPSAQDTHYTSIASIFSNTTKVDLTTINKSDIKGQVTWEEDNYNNYSNQDYVLEKIKKIVDPHNDRYMSRQEKAESASYEEQFNKIILMTDVNLLNSNSFKLALIDLNKEPLTKILVNRYNSKDDNTDLFFINFSEQIFQDKFLLNAIQGEEFNLLGQLFEAYIEKLNKYENYRSPSYPKPSSDIDFENLINQPGTIKYLVHKYSYSSSRKSNDFDILSAYRFLDETNKYDSKVIDKYLNLIIDTSHSRDSRYIRDSELFKLPPDLFNQKDFLSKITDVLDFDRLKKFLNKNGIEPTVLSDKDFILSNLGIADYKLKNWIASFVDKKDITKEFIKDILTSKPSFYNQLDTWSKFQKDMELIALAVRGGYNLKSINSATMYELLTKDHEPKYEELKVRYLIEQKLVTDITQRFKHMGYKPEEIAKVKEKYEKPQYMFYTVDTWHSEYDNTRKALSKLKNIDDVFDVVNKIKKDNFSYEFNANFFYKSLHAPLKKNKKLVDLILNLGPIRYLSLDENLAYNTDIIIKCLSNTPKDLINIPHELFTNSNFAIKFAKLLDRGNFEDKYIPSFITKFFENQEVTEDYEKYLKMHLTYKEMQGDLDLPTTQVKTKRVKI